MPWQNPGTLSHCLQWSCQCTATLTFFTTMYTADVKIACVKLLQIDSTLPTPYTCITVGLVFHYFPFTASSVYVGAQRMPQQQQCTCILPLHTYCKMFCGGFGCSGILHCVIWWGVLGYYTVSFGEVFWDITLCHLVRFSGILHCVIWWGVLGYYTVSFGEVF